MKTCPECGMRYQRDCRCGGLEGRADGSLERVVSRLAVAGHFGCTADCAETRITNTMEILRLNREEAEAFLMAVHPVAIAKPANEKAEAQCPGEKGNNATKPN